MSTFSNIYSGKKVLITGHTGFKGTWLSLWLKILGADVYGLSIDILPEPSHFTSADISNQINDNRLDIRDGEGVKKLVQCIQPDFVFHLAAQALVIPSYNNPIDTMHINAIGSANLLEALRQSDKLVTAVMVTSDKAYDNVEWDWGYRETDKLGGSDPYSASKGMAELAIRSFVDSYFSLPDCPVHIGIARAGNVIGGGDWSSYRIVPDCMRAWSNGDYVDIRSPDATRPWQHVLEPLSGYLTLGASLSINRGIHGEAYNFGPPEHQNHSVRELIYEMSSYWDSVSWNDISNSQQHLHESSLLKLNCDKALFDLQWQPTLTFRETVRMTVDWYRYYYQKTPQSMYDFTVSQIEEYSKLYNERKL